MKSRNQHKIRFLYICLLTLIFGCQEEIQLDLNPNNIRQIAVEGRLLNKYQNQSVRLTYSQDYLDGTLPPPVLDAEIELIAESTGEVFPLTLGNDTFGIYITETMAGKVGESYTLRVNHNGAVYEAATYLDNLPVIDSINYTYDQQSFFGIIFGTYNFYLNFYEPAPAGDYYMIQVYLNDTLYTDEVIESIYLSDFQQNDQYWSNAQLQSFAMPQEDIRLDTNTVRFEMFSISEDELNYLGALFQEVYANGSLFSGPPANIPTNFYNTNGGVDGLGYYAASSKTEYEFYLFKEHNDSTNNSFFED